MEWINRYIDRPLLDGAASGLRTWHIRCGKDPEQWEPTWHLCMLSLLLIVAAHYLRGSELVLCASAVAILALPSVYKLVFIWKAVNTYARREYVLHKKRALIKRQTEWSVRMAVLFVSASLPFLAWIVDSAGRFFLLGASLWFVLTIPVKFFLQAAEPPEPDEGDRSFQNTIVLG
ncbi:hypothetical protein [Rhizobium sp. RCC_161_2]|uniref:hypothetical protein n=1 Tax=Rhizobium sp. RCC_161_2 TaxID=3239219 RepID=UPI0035249795